MRVVSDYDVEAEDYDRTRGGLPRARAAAEALNTLLPPRSPVLELAVGTGIVAAELTALGHHVLGIDISGGMLDRAQSRLHGRVIRADAQSLPLRTASLDAVTAIWLLHLLTDANPLLTEVARVLRPGGLFITTVDKSAATRLTTGAAPRPTWPADNCALLTLQGARHHLHPTAATSFIGHGQANPGHPCPRYPVLAFRRS